MRVTEFALSALTHTFLCPASHIVQPQTGTPTPAHSRSHTGHPFTHPPSAPSPQPWAQPHCRFTTAGTSPVKSASGHIYRGQGEMKEEAGPSRQCRAVLVSRRTYEAYLRCPKTGRSLHPPSRTFKVYGGLSGVQSHLHPHGLQDVLLSQSCVLGKAPSVGRVGGVYIPRKGEAVRSLGCPPPVTFSKTHRCTLCPCVHISPRSLLSLPMLSSTDTNSFCIPTCTSVTCPGKSHFRVKGHHASFYLQREM